ncbi:uncharacterized membrane protein (DUF106 family) [Desulfomicrobium macestii]|uniref:Uncharacterized membrane protein (DUF106 family) n=1 Tax=Desulfomicrobium macestii TaxID=90731 RepID=A0ABR9H8I3_9BACT|nr:hypothetical protein [Desulfomicrobium macestii]MBE1427016.1 uncharacterized membrane protein (DUF106 family) [Desulfomicrobium macestii]
MTIEKLKKHREELKQELKRTNEKIRILERQKDAQKLARMAQLINEKGFTLAQILEVKRRKRRADTC